MTLSNDDKAFIRERIAITWANHFIVTSALVKIGHRPWNVGREIVARNNLPRNRQFFDLPRMRNSRELRARVQGMVALRIWQEYVAAMENAGAFLRAIGLRNDGGVMWRNFKYEVSDVRMFYRTIARRRSMDATSVLGLPSVAALRAQECPAKLWQRAERVYPWASRTLRAVARTYVRTALVRPVKLVSRVSRTDPRNHVYVFVDVPAADGEVRKARRERRGVVEVGMNKLKHGCNATTAQPPWANAHAGRGIWAIPISTKWETIRRLGTSSDLMGALCRELGRLVLDLDSVGAV